MIRRTMPLASVALVLIAVLFTCGCTDAGGADEGTVEGIGPIAHAYGGLYVIQAADGARYAPFNLDESYRVDGMAVSFHGVVPEDSGVSDSPGIPLEIRDIGTYVPPGSNATIALEKIWL